MRDPVEISPTAITSDSICASASPMVERCLFAEPTVSSPLVVVVAGLPGASAAAWLRSTLNPDAAPATVLVIDRWMPRLFLDDGGLFDAAQMAPCLHEAVARSLLNDAGLRHGEVRRATVAEVLDRVGSKRSVGVVIVVPSRRLRERPRRAWLVRRLRRASESGWQVLPDSGR